MSSYRIEPIEAADTYPLRLAVLRDNTPSTDVVFDGDSEPGVLHLGTRNTDGELVAVSTWMPRALDDRVGVQLRGMATAAHVQGQGLGGLLLEEGCRRCADRGVTLVWANARDTALDFYHRHGFVVEGDGFIAASSGLPHHVVLRTLV